MRKARARHEFITVEHLLLALMNNDAALEVLRNVGANAAKLTSELEKYIEETTPVLPVSDEEHGPQTTLGFSGWFHARFFTSSPLAAKK